jgi:hypothetical protein
MLCIDLIENQTPFFLLRIIPQRHSFSVTQWLSM